MCGIAGILNLREGPAPDVTVLRQMLAQVQHRGPDGAGVYRDQQVGLGHARLSIIDLAGGWQPIGNEDGSLWIVFNGEIFNYVELRPGLEAKGHRFSTHSDTEVLLHLYEERGPACLEELNGQFAFAIWDSRRRSLFLARDRLGVRPLFYTENAGRLIFGSEIKSLLACPGVKAEMDEAGLREVFTYWSVLPPRTIFRNIRQVPPGHYLWAEGGAYEARRYWSLDFAGEERTVRPTEDYLEELAGLLVDATLIRLRADVPVGAYLSGGLDSSLTAAIIRSRAPNRLDTFSISFEDRDFDESRFQGEMAAALGTTHHVVRCSYSDIAAAFPDVIWHTETPVLRTAPAPMFLLSKLVHDTAFKVVVTGEGADEFLAGYDIFKEMKVRRFWAKQPESRIRPLLLRRLYPDIARLSGANGAFLAGFFRRGMAEVDSPYYSHAIRWGNGARLRRFLAAAAGESGGEAQMPSLPPDFGAWSPLAQAQYLEITTFLSPYLLASQGDRVAMAHSVEGRFPFLDHRLVQFCNRLPSRVKLYGLTEKWLLKQLGRRLVPSDIWQRPKRPYRAPIYRCFFGQGAPEYVRELLSEGALSESGLFDAAPVTLLAGKAAAGQPIGEVEDMALAGVLSTQLVYHQFVKSFRLAPLPRSGQLKVVDRMAQPA